MISIKHFFKKLPADEQGLEDLAQQLGVSMFNTQEEKFGRSGMNIYEVQRRIREAIADAKGSWLWLLAFLSAVASVLSALAAWKVAIN